LDDMTNVKLVASTRISFIKLVFLFIPILVLTFFFGSGILLKLTTEFVDFFGEGNPELVHEFVDFFETFDSDAIDISSSVALVQGLKDSSERFSEMALETVRVFKEYDEHFQNLVIDVVSLQRLYGLVTNQAWTAFGQGFAFSSDVKRNVELIFEFLQNGKYTEASLIVEAILAQWRAVVKQHTVLLEHLELLEQDLTGLVDTCRDGETVCEARMEENVRSWHLTEFSGYFLAAAVGGIPGLGVYTGANMLKQNLEKNLPKEKQARLHSMANAYKKFNSELQNVRARMQTDDKQASLLLEAVENVGRSIKRLDLTFSGQRLRSDDVSIIEKAKEKALMALDKMSEKYSHYFQTPLIDFEESNLNDEITNLNDETMSTEDAAEYEHENQVSWEWAEFFDDEVK